MRPTLALAFALALALVPTLARAGSTCDPSGSVCGTDSNFADGACGSGGFESHSTSVTAGVDVVSGTSTCSGSPGSSQSTNTVQLANGAVTWEELAYDDPDTGHFDGCFLFVLGVYESCPAQASPPNPGWGHLLP